MAFCTKPFSDLAITPGFACTCCSSWLTGAGIAPYDSEADPADLWNAPEIAELRGAILAEDPTYCRSCPWFCAGKTPNDPSIKTAVIMDRGPRVLSLDVDPSCNLWCRQCRPRRIRLDAGELIERCALADRILDAFLPGLEVLSCSSVGDGIASPVGQHVWERLAGDCPDGLAIRLCTNGILLPLFCARFQELVGRIRFLHISIDAATAETYQRLRRGAMWRELLVGLRLAKRLRTIGTLRELIFNFACQAENFREMPAFVGLAREYSATRVVFTPLRHKAHIGDYRARSLAALDHPDRAEFLRVLADPALTDPICDLRHLAPRSLAAIRRAYHDP